MGDTKVFFYVFLKDAINFLKNNLAVIKKRLFLQRHYEGSEVRWRMNELRGQNAP